MQPKIKEFGHLVGIPLEKGNDNIDPSFSIRVTKIDGQPCVVTHDFRLDRINVEIENGIITNVTGLG